MKKDLKAIDKPFYNFLQGLYLSFYSSSFYIDVAKRWTGFGILYTLMLIAILNIPLSLRMMYNFHQYFEKQIIGTISSLPPLVIQNGALKVNYKKPRFIYNKSQQVSAVIDPENIIDPNTKLYPELVLLVQKNQLIFHAPSMHKFLKLSFPENNQTPFIQKFAPNTNEVFVGKEWLSSEGISVIYWLGMFLIYPIMALFTFGFLATLLIMMIILGQIFASSIFQVSLTFKASARLLLVAATPTLYVFFITLALNLALPGMGFLYIVLMSLYFSYAILAVKKEDKKLVLH